MKIIINGQANDVAAGTTIGAAIAELSARKGLKPEIIVVEYNSEIVQRERWADIILQQGDSLEIITFVGGG